MNDNELCTSKINGNDGGPAFPFTFQELDGQGNPRSEMITHVGMSLRDWFAGMALSGMCADSNLKDSQHVFAKISYKIADAMLAERNHE